MEVETYLHDLTNVNVSPNIWLTLWLNNVMKLKAGGFSEWNFLKSEREKS